MGEIVAKAVAKTTRILFSRIIITKTQNNHFEDHQQKKKDRIAYYKCVR